MEPKSPLQCSQKSVTGPYHARDKSTPPPAFTEYFFKIHFNNILLLNVGLFSHISGILINICTEKYRLPECGAEWVCYKPTFRRNVSPPSSG
jgi:hypothetical protein